jgi:DNA end-binding protein Ku
MSRAIWKGTVAFGLVEIPVALHSATAQEEEIRFSQLDKRDLSPIGYERVNKKTGKPVAWDDIVKGYEHAPGEFVVLSEEELRDANVEATQTIEIVDFVDAKDIAYGHWDTPYYLEPVKKQKSKSYALLREVLRRSGRAGIAKVVIRTRQRLAALTVTGDAITLHVLRWAYELRDPDDLALPKGSNAELGLGEKEIDLAEKLVESMSTKWKPDSYHDEYRKDVLALVERKVKAGKSKEVEVPTKRRAPAKTGEVIDLMPLLKESMDRKATRTVAAETRRGERRTAKRKQA